MSERKFELLVVTPEGNYPQETSWVNRLFEAGLEGLHLRKPGWKSQQLLHYIRQIDVAFYPRIMLHYAENLLQEGNFRGVHYRATELPLLKPGYTVSCGIHSWQEFQQLEQRLDYAFVSPFFDSISKEGYRANAQLLQIPAGVKKEKAFALGGINRTTIGKVYKMGLGGAAVLGSIWQGEKPLQHFKQLTSKKNECLRQGHM